LGWTIDGGQHKAVLAKRLERGHIGPTADRHDVKTTHCPNFILHFIAPVRLAKSQYLAFKSETRASEQHQVETAHVGDDDKGSEGPVPTQTDKPPNICIDLYFFSLLNSKQPR
jgi:hypothetical protein